MGVLAEPRALKCLLWSQEPFSFAAWGLSFQILGPLFMVAWSHLILGARTLGSQTSLEHCLHKLVLTTGLTSIMVLLFLVLVLHDRMVCGAALAYLRSSFAWFCGWRCCSDTKFELNQFCSLSFETSVEQI